MDNLVRLKNAIYFPVNADAPQEAGTEIISFAENGSLIWPEPTYSLIGADQTLDAEEILFQNNTNCTDCYLILLEAINNSSIVSEELVISIHHPALAILLALLCIIVVFGNILVMVAVAKEQYLHTVTNYFIASLAMADCLVGAVVMPFSAVHEAMDKYWIFGQDWCDAWHSIDVLASTASILNLCVISLDRYWAITDPMTYPSRMTPARACALIALVWTCSSAISFPAIAWWRAVSQDPPPPYQCLFTEDIGYLVFSSIISFYGPLTIMVFTYFRIYRAAMEQTRSLKLGCKQIQSCDGDNCTSLTLRIHRGGVFQPAAVFKSAGNKYSEEEQPASPGESANGFEKASLRGGVPRHIKAFSLSRKLSKLAKERKAAKTLGIVMGVFILCWLPFFVTNVLMGVCGEECVMEPDLVVSIVTWLGWINSGMNPAIYACWSRDFRRAFKKLLCCCCFRGSSRRPRYNSRYRKTIKGETTSLKSSLAEEVTL